MEPSGSSDTKYIVVSKDGINFSMSKNALVCSKTMETLLDTMNYDPESIGPIPVAVSSQIMPKIVEWCEHHRDDEPEENKNRDPATRRVSKWDKQFFEGLSSDEVHQLAIAANYLDIEKVVLYCSLQLVERCKGKSVQEMADFYGYSISGAK